MIRVGNLVRYTQEVAGMARDMLQHIVPNNKAPVGVVIRDQYEGLFQETMTVDGVECQVDNLKLCVDVLVSSRVIKSIPVEHLERIR